MKYTKKQLEKAFEQWIKESRLNPKDFLTEQQVNEMNLIDLAKDNVKWLLSYVKK